MLSRAAHAADLGQAPAECIEQPALPHTVSNALTDLRRLCQLGDGGPILTKAAERLAAEPSRPDHQVREPQPAAGRDHLLADRDAAQVIAAPLRDLRHVEADEGLYDLVSGTRRQLRRALHRRLLSVDVPFADDAEEASVADRQSLSGRQTVAVRKL